jgi:hypothetical protein
MTRSLKVALLHLAPELAAVDRNRALIESGTRVGGGGGGGGGVVRGGGGVGWRF